MIWHIYGKNEKVVINEQQHQMIQHTYASSSEDTMMQTDEEGDSSAPEDVDLNKNKPLFLNFTSDLSPQPICANKRKKTSANATSYTNAQPAFKVNGVNLLNRKNLDSKTVVDRIQKRRENHNHVERKRRDYMNNTILTLSQIIPHASLPGQKLNKGNVLKLAVDHILHLQSENVAMKHQLNQFLESRTVLISPKQDASNTCHELSSNRTHRPILPMTSKSKIMIPRLMPKVVEPSASTFFENKLYFKGSCRYMQ